MKNHQLKKAFRLYKEREIDFQDYTEKQKFILFDLILHTQIQFDKAKKK